METKGLNVLSLFDGMSCGQIALNNLGIKVENYFASEINKHAIKVTQNNFSNTIQLGDISKVSYKDGVLYSENGKFNIGSIDLMMGGSPCTNLSFSGKQQGLRGETIEEYLELKNNGFDFGKEQSHLFWEYVRLLKEINPTYFLLENVRMKKYWLDVISKNLDVEPIKDEKGKPYINSSLVSAQNRIRSYWTNIPNVKQPEDKGILLKDIVHEYNDDVELSGYIVPCDNTFKILDKELQQGKVGFFRKDSQANRVYYINGKSITLTGESGGGAAKMGQYLFGNIKLENGIKTIEGYIRKLTPIECERLQTVKDNYTNYVSKSQRYRMLGNGWTVKIIEHILKNIIWLKNLQK